VTSSVARATSGFYSQSGYFRFTSDILLRLGLGFADRLGLAGKPEVEISMTSSTFLFSASDWGLGCDSYSLFTTGKNCKFHPVTARRWRQRSAMRLFIYVSSDATLHLSRESSFPGIRAAVFVSWKRWLTRNPVRTGLNWLQRRSRHTTSAHETVSISASVWPFRRSRSFKVTDLVLIESSYSTSY